MKAIQFLLVISICFAVAGCHGEQDPGGTKPNTSGNSGMPTGVTQDDQKKENPIGSKASEPSVKDLPPAGQTNNHPGAHDGSSNTPNDNAEHNSRGQTGTGNSNR